MAPFHLRLAWHERSDDDPAQQWFRGLFTELVPDRKSSKASRAAKPA
jgi:hypothetical protein